jgi:hypothetical protein
MAVDSSPAPSEPSVGDALIHLFESGQRLVLDRIDLARFDLRELAGRTVRGAALAVIGGVLLAGGWFMAMASAVVWLRQYLPLAASLAIVAVVSAVLGATAIAVALRPSPETNSAHAGRVAAPDGTQAMAPNTGGTR